MGIAASQFLVVDVLENGRLARASFFDIADADQAELRDPRALPVCRSLGRVLESQQLQLELADGAFHCASGGALPSRSDTYAQILTSASTPSPSPRADGGSRSCSILRLEHLPGAPRPIGPDRGRLPRGDRQAPAAALAKESAETRARRGDGARLQRTRRIRELRRARRCLGQTRSADWACGGDE